MARTKRQAVNKYLDPAVVSHLGNMELKARLIVEGYIAGLHRSPYHGFSVEFAEYRQYMQGDNTRHIDWKVYGKTDRFYMKVFEEETNLRATVILDKSGSMGFASPASQTAKVSSTTGVEIDKLTYGGLLAASLSYLMIRQQDAVGLCLFDEQVRALTAHRAVRKHLFYLLSSLERSNPVRKHKSARRSTISPNGLNGVGS